MKITAMTTMILMAGAGAYGRSPDMAPEGKVTVCVEGMGLPEIAGAGPKARILTSQIFAGIGVTIEWRYKLRGCPPEGIQVSLTVRTPNSLKPGALAYALPFEGTHIRVFYDRVSVSHNSSQVPIVLGHVLAHEITHILQGIDRHSKTGVMKARWNQSDFSNMSRRALPFEADDVQLIYLGLEDRAKRQALAQNSSDTRAALQLQDGNRGHMIGE